jgi:chromosome partitioning protein
MIISVLNIKGGVGKTTVATNLAVGVAKTGKSVLVIDTDTQGSAVAWRGERDEERAAVTVISLSSAAALRKQIIGFRDSFDCVIIDGSPHVDALAAVSIAASNLVILPVGPSPLDIWATSKMVSQIEDAQVINPEIKASFVINKFSQVTLLSRETKEVLEEFSIPVFNTTLGSRVAYADTITQGLSALEWSDKKAKEEVKSFVNEVLGLISWERLSA